MLLHRVCIDYIRKMVLIDHQLDLQPVRTSHIMTILASFFVYLSQRERCWSFLMMTLWLQQFRHAPPSQDG